VSIIQNQGDRTGFLPSLNSAHTQWHVSDVLLPVSLIMWAVAVTSTDTRVLGTYGLLSVLPLIFYAAIALLIVSVTTELIRRHISRWRMSAHAVALVVMLYGTAPIVYSQGRYGWLYKTVGVVQYMGAHGKLDQRIDIYQNWPGFFAFAAWFDKVAGVASPLAYAKWAQLVVELAALPLLYLIYEALALPPRQRWVALLLYSSANWVAQDYFSPQALGTLLSLGIMAMVMRWMYAGNSWGRTALTSQSNEDGSRAYSGQQLFQGVSHLTLFFVALVLVYSALTYTHEISPYIVITQLAALAIASLFRPRWLPLALAAVAVIYFLPRFSFVNGHYGVLSSIGSFFSNAAPPSIANSDTSIPASQLRIQHCADALALLIWGLSLVGAWLRRRSRRTVAALVLLAYSPLIVLVAGAYGDEGILRVYLFSLPWSAALAAAVLTPTPSLPARSGRSRPKDGASRWHRLPPGALRVPLVLGVVVALFLVAFFGDDRFNVMSDSEVTTVTSFMQTAPAGPVLSGIGNAPSSDTSRYNLYPLDDIFGSGAAWGTTKPPSDIADVLAGDVDRYTLGAQPAYLMVTSSMIAYGQAYGTPPDYFTTLLNSVAHSRYWKLIVKKPDVIIYELPPKTFPQGFNEHGPTPYFIVPLPSCFHTPGAHDAGRTLLAVSASAGSSVQARNDGVMGSREDTIRPSGAALRMGVARALGWRTIVTQYLAWHDAVLASCRYRDVSVLYDFDSGRKVL
jgi:hypothetical protein